MCFWKFIVDNVIGMAYAEIVDNALSKSLQAQDERFKVQVYFNKIVLEKS